MTNKNIYIVFALIALAFITRFLPHAPNFTAVGAMALFAGAKLNNKKAAFLIPLVVMILSDIIIGYHSTLLAVYVSFVLIGLVGMLVSKTNRPQAIAIGSLAGSALFFIITNFFTWYSMDMYPKTGGGLLTCYTAAIPFFSNTLLSDLMYNALLFGAFHLITQSNLTKQKA